MGQKSGSASSIHSLPWFEQWFYRLVHIGSVIYISWCVYKASLKYDGVLNLYAFEPGWKVLGKEQDVSNYEWFVFYRWLWITSPFYLGHVALTKILRWNFPEYRNLTVLYSVAVLVHLLGVRVVLLYLIHCVIMYGVSSLKSTAAVWITSLSLLTTLNFKLTNYWTKYFIPHENEDQEFYILSYTLAFMQLRYTSFCLEKCRNKIVKNTETSVIKSEAPESKSSIEETAKPYMEKPDAGTISDYDDKSGSPSKPHDDIIPDNFIDMLNYVFYLPLFFTGPVLTYDLFRLQIKRPREDWTRERCTSLFLDFIRAIFWTFVNELLLHYLYFGAIQQNLSVMEAIDMWTLAGIGYWNGQFFMTKYQVLFSYPAWWAKLEGMDPPRGPKCIAYIYTYSDMWKYFDIGMYSFIKRYIFIPLGGSHHGIYKKMLTSIVCFSFVYYWHGSEYYIFLWSLFNFVGIAVEVLAGILINYQPIQKFQMRYMRPACIRRLYASCAVPLYLMSVITAFCFFGGSTVGYIFYDRVILRGWFKSWMTVTFVLYCCIQSSMEIKRNQEIRLKAYQTNRRQD